MKCYIGLHSAKFLHHKLLNCLTIMDEKRSVLVLIVVALVICGALSACKAEQCGSQANWALCGGGLCCSKYGWCGLGDQYCGDGCQSGPCTGGGGGGGGGGDDVGSIVSDSAFNRFLSQRTSGNCPANGFYTRSAFLSAASAFKGFGTTGDATTKKRELAAFFANIAHESGSGCYKEEIARGLYCDQSLAPCAPGKQYYGRGPIQITWNYNYRIAGNAIGFDGINNPDIVASDPVISFKTAVWYWMTQHSPTCHAAIVNGQGFGATIRAINGGLECGPSGNKAQQQARITLYKSFCSILGVDPGNNLTC